MEMEERISNLNEEIEYYVVSMSKLVISKVYMVHWKFPFNL